MIQTLLNRLDSLEGLKTDVERDLQTYKKEEHNEFYEAANKLSRFIDVYKETLSTFMFGESKKITVEKYQEHMKGYDDDLFFHCNQFTFLKAELLEDKNGQK